MFPRPASLSSLFTTSSFGASFAKSGTGESMAELAQSAQHEFWRPPMSAAIAASGQTDMVEACNRCGTEFIVGALFCHTCGAGRAGTHSSAAARLREGVYVAQIFGERLGLSTGAFIAFAIGVCVLVGALAVGVILPPPK